MAANSGQLFVDFGGNDDWEEVGLECVGTPGLCISALTKISEVLGRLST